NGPVTGTIDTLPSDTTCTASVFVTLAVQAPVPSKQPCAPFASTTPISWSCWTMLTDSTPTETNTACETGSNLHVAAAAGAAWMISAAAASATASRVRVSEVPPGARCATARYRILTVLPTPRTCSSLHRSNRSVSASFAEAQAWIEEHVERVHD